MSLAAASFVLPNLIPKTLVLCKSITPFPTLISFSSSPLSLHVNPYSALPPVLHCRRELFLEKASSSRFVLKVAFSSEFEQEEDEEDVFDDGDQRSYSSDLKLFVGNLPFSVDSSVISELFQQAGNVQTVEVIYDKMTERSRGFAFVTMSTPEEVEAAAQQFNGYELEGRPLRVNFGPPPARKENQYSGRGRGGASYYDDSRSGRGRGGRSFYDDSRSGRGRGGGSFYDDSRSGRGRGGGSFYDDSRSGRGRGGGSFYDDSRSGRDRGGGSFYDDSHSERGSGGASFGDANRLHVSNLAWGVDDLALETLFSEQGNVVEAKVVYDRESGRSRGFGFVTYRSAKEVNSAIESLNGADLDGRPIRVSMAEGRQRRQF